MHQPPVLVHLHRRPDSVRPSLSQARRLADQALDRLKPTFCRLYPEGGRPSISPEQLLLALLLQAIYGIRSERMMMEQLDYNLLVRWFAGLNPDDFVWHPTTFNKNRDRLLNEELPAKYPARIWLRGRANQVDRS